MKNFRNDITINDLKGEEVMEDVTKAMVERRGFWNKIKAKAMEKEAGIDGILVTVGLCIIALLLCVVMKDSMTTFIQTIVNSMTSQAQKILTGVAMVGLL